MEQIMSNIVTSPSSLLVIIFESIILMNWVILLHDFYSSFRYIFDFLVSTWKVWCWSECNTNNVNVNVNAEVPKQNLCSIENRDEKKLFRKEVEMAMENLGNLCDLDVDKLQERTGLNEIAVLFEEEEPGMEEVKAAFDIFDENGDGFIDARELNEVLSKLGFNMISSEKECKRMIRTFDDNGDGRIDFDEFLKLVEKSFC